jgi:hypothetical protein
MSLRIRRGTDSQRQGITFDLGEIAYTTDTKKIYVGDGVSLGGNNVLESTAGAGLQWNSGTEQLDVDGTGLTTSNIVEGSNYYFTPDRAQDSAAALFTHAGHTAISFIYDDTAGIITATVSLDGVGIVNVQADTDPHLGGDLVLNSHDITGTGGIDLTGNITATSISADLGGDLGLNSYDITGTGNINITGDITATSISADLGGDLGLNSHDITGTGNINITGSIAATTITANLGGNLGLNTHDITGTGNIDIAGSIAATTITANLGGNLGLNTHDITGTGNIDIAGDIYITGSLSLSDTLTVNTNDRIFENYHIINSTSPTTAGSDIYVSRGTLVSPQAIQNGDILSDYTVKGFDGNSFIALSSLYFQAAGTQSVGSINGHFGIAVGDYVLSPGTTKLYQFHSDGGFTLPIGTSQPTSPTSGTMYICDATLWNPASKPAGIPYPVFYDGVSYNALY